MSKLQKAITDLFSAAKNCNNCGTALMDFCNTHQKQREEILKKFGDELD